MFRIFDKRWRRFSRDYERIVSSHNPDEVIKTCHDLLSQIADLPPSFFANVEPWLATWQINFQLGTAYIYSKCVGAERKFDLAIEALYNSIAALEGRRPRCEVESLLSLSIAFADRLTGDSIENSAQAVECCQKALTVSQEIKEVGLEMKARSTLVHLYDNSPSGSILENYENAILHQEALCEHYSQGSDAEKSAYTKAGLADLLVKREAGSRRDNVERALKLVSEAEGLGTPLSNRVKARVLEAKFNCLTQRVLENKDEAFAEALNVAEDVFQLLGSEGAADTLANFQVTVALAWSNLRSARWPNSMERAEYFFCAALDHFTPERSPIENERIRALLQSVRMDSRGIETAEELLNGIERQRELIREVEGGVGGVSWIDRSLELCTMLRRSSAPDSEDMHDEAVRVYRDILGRTSYATHREQWLTAMRGLASSLKLAAKPGTHVQANLETKSILEEIFETVDPRSEPEVWVRSCLELADFISKDTSFSFQDNLERAIAVLEEARVVARPETYPELSAAVEMSLASYFKDRVRGVRKENILEVLACYLSAKPVLARIASVHQAQRHEFETLELVRELRRLADAESTGDAAQENTSNRNDEVEKDEDEDDVTARGQQYVDTMIAKARVLSNEESFDDWYTLLLKAAELQQYVMPKTDQGSPVEAFTDAVLKNYEASVQILIEIREGLEKRTHSGKWMDLHWKLSGTLRMCQLWADFRKTALRRSAHDARVLRTYQDKSNQFLSEAAKNLEEVIELCSQEHSPAKYLSYATRLGRIQYELGNVDEAYQRFMQAAASANVVLSYPETFNAEREATLQHLNDLATIAPAAAVEMGKPEAAIELSEAARARSLIARLHEFNTVQSDDTEQVQLIKQDILEAEQRLERPLLMHRRPHIEEIMRSKSELRRIIGSMKFTDAFSFDNLSKKLSAFLEDGCIFVFPFISEFGGQVVVLMMQDNKVVLESAAADKYDELSDLFTEGLPGETALWQSNYLSVQSSGGNIDVVDWGQTLSGVSEMLGQAILAPSLSILEKHGVGLKDFTNVVFIPVGPLGCLPLGLSATSADGEQPLLEACGVSIVPSLTSLVSYPNQPIADKKYETAVVYNTSTTGPLKALPFSFFEAHSIASVDVSTQSKSLNSETSSPEEIADALQQSRIWHFIGHGEGTSTDGTWNLSLGNGLNIDRDSVHKYSEISIPEMVVLSACYTGLYGLKTLPNEFVGLPTAFLASGVKTVIASLWPTEDVSSALLFGQFYKNLLIEEQSASIALRGAQLWLRTATQIDIQETLEAWSSVDADASSAARLRDLIASLPSRSRGVDDRPFQSPVYWGGFTCVGG